MKSILKKNQIIISVIAIMLIAAGYMSYTTNTKNSVQTAALSDTEQYAELGDATLVSANVVEENNIVDNNVNTSSTPIDNQYFTESRLERDKMYSQMLESYQNILTNNQISDSQKRNIRE